MATNWNAEMRERFEKLEKKVDALDDKVSTLDTKVTTLSGELKATEERLTKNVKLETEHMRELVQKAAEGYGATLERIDRNITEMRNEWHAKWTGPRSSAEGPRSSHHGAGAAEMTGDG